TTRLRAQLSGDHSGAMHRLRTIIAEVVDFSFQHPQLYEMMKAGLVPADNPHWNAQRDDLFNLIEQTIRAGVDSGELRDAHPALTARMIPGMVRNAILFTTKDSNALALKESICQLIESGLACNAPTPARV